MTKQIRLTIGNKQVTVPEGTLIVDAAKNAGIVIPVFCYHPKLEPVGMCRICLVDISRPVIDQATGKIITESDGSPKIQFGPKLETACTTPVSEGMVVITDSPLVMEARKDILEFLLTSHPLDCPICDKGGECPLQNLTLSFGPGQSRFHYDEKKHLAKEVPLGELIFLDRERCIQCSRCIRFQEEIVDDHVLGFYQRGRSMEIISCSEPGFDSYWSGNTTDICPVGALTTADFRFGARPWELNTSASICPHCPVGCNLTINTRREAASGGRNVIKRVMPRQNEWVNEIWICDKGRFGYHFTEAKDRLDQPLIRKDGELKPSSWDEAIELVSHHFKKAGSGLLSLVGGRLSDEDLFNIRQLTNTMQGQTALYSSMAGGDLISSVGAGQGTNFADLSSNTAILVVASNLEEEAPLWWLRIKQAAERGATLIVANPRQTKLDRYASHLIRYPYGSEATVVLAMINELSAKRPRLPIAIKELTDKSKLNEAAQTFAIAENALVLFGSEGTGLHNSKALAQACANLLSVTNHTGRANNGLIAIWQHGNEQGAWDMGFQPLADLKTTMKNAQALYIVAADPAGDDPNLIESSNFLVVQDLFLTATAKLADVVLPAQAFSEREGSYTSGERRVQRFFPAVPPKYHCQADYAITARIAKQCGIQLEENLASLIFDQISEAIPDYAGISYQDLCQTPEQWPLVGQSDLYFGGTTYENKQGIGIQLRPATQGDEISPLAWYDPPEPVTIEAGLLGVPITKLYDHGRTILASQLLHNRLTPACLLINHAEARKLGIANNDLLQVQFNDTTTLATACLDDDVPNGVVLIPRSTGIPLDKPQAVIIQVAQRA
jgi:NADH-quinone oxidoreductase subunit G